MGLAHHMPSSPRRQAGELLLRPPSAGLLLLRPSLLHLGGDLVPWEHCPGGDCVGEAYLEMEMGF